MFNIPQKRDLLVAAERLSPYIHNTPVLNSRMVNELAGCRLFFKCENFQKTGAFKFRGALNTVLSLNDDEAQNGVATHSSGNHAQALAYAAQIRGVRAYVVMPDNASPVKIEATRGYGAEIFFCEPTLEAREKGHKKVIDETGAYSVHPYDDCRIIAGQGTVCMELLRDNPKLDYILTPVGGGGLLSGTALAANYFGRDIRVIGCEPQVVDDASRSFHSGKWQPAPNIPTVADGLKTSLGKRNFAIIKDHVYDILTVSEEEIIAAMQLLWQYMKILIEPSSAVPLAVLLKNKEMFSDDNVAIIISGGNVNLQNLPW